MNAILSSHISSADFASPQTALVGKGRKAAREFEGQLIGTILQSLEKTFAQLPGQSEIAGADEYNSLGVQALSSGLAAAGGFGIARLITPSLERTKGADSAPATAEINTAKASLSYADGTR